MRLIFKVQDSSGEGRLSKEDTAKVLRRLWPDVTTELLDSTFAAADADKDGTLSADEFLMLARSNQHLWPSLKSSLCGRL
jgi:Ca2+-binding EF-hand superfamily protein